MNITMSQIKEAKKILAALKPKKVTLNGNRSLTVKETIFALPPTLERIKKRGFDTEEIAEKLHEKGIEIKPPTLAKYMSEFRRGTGQGKGQKKDPPRAEWTCAGSATRQQTAANDHIQGNSQHFRQRSFRFSG